MSHVKFGFTNLSRLLAGVFLLLATVTASHAVDLTGAGATFPYPLYSKWFDVYGEKGDRINYQSIGSGGGIKQLQAGTVDFGASDAPLSDEEMKAMPGPVAHIPTAAGSVAIIYNVPGVKNGLHLTGSVLAGIFLGEITKWNDKRITALNPKVKLPATPIIVARRSDGSGTTYIFTDYLATVSKTWENKVGRGKSVNWPVGLGGKGSEGVSGVVKQMPGAIGYVELAYALHNDMTYASLKNKHGAYVAPSLASTTAAAAGAIAAMKKDIRVSIVNADGKDSYPIAGFTYILLLKKQADRIKGESLVNFLWWAIHDGQAYAEKLVYAPLPKEVVQLNETALKTITSGGKALLKK